MAQKLTTETFAEKAKYVHGDKYDYSKVNYINAHTKIIIICKEHGEFLQTPNGHLTGKNCPYCVGGIKLTKEEFIEKSNRVHNNKYDYSKANYINAHTNIIIICPIHNEFEQVAGTHIDGAGCPKCAGRNKTTEEFTEDAKKIHGDKYDYSKADYISAKEKIIIICKKHGAFNQYSNVHLNGGGCPKCAKKHRRTAKEFIEDAVSIHGDKYDYSLSEFKRVDKSVLIICKEHGVFEQTPSKHLMGRGCDKCGGSYNYNTEDFAKEAKNIHGGKYDYSKTEYINNKTEVVIICSFHGEFWQTPSAHIHKKAGCPICNRGWQSHHKLQLLNSLQYSDLLTMDPIELSIIIGQGNIPVDFRPLIHTPANTDERISTLQEIKERLEQEVEQTPSDEQYLPLVPNNEEGEEFAEVDDVDEEITRTVPYEEPRLPQINPISDLHSLDNSLYATMDLEAIESLVQYKLRKLWNTVLNDDFYVNDLRNEIGGEYFTKIKELFFEEYDKVVTYAPPSGYSFGYQPNLMQKLTVQRLLKNKSYGNWSGTGAGKTLSFIIASRELDARLTVVIALNSTIEQTCKAIKSVYPDSKTFTKYENDFVFDRNSHNYLILNYEKFQQEYSEEMFQSLTNNNQIDFVVIDEVHNSKQRDENNESIRRGTLNKLIGRARENNENLHVLVMSATPVINTLFEAVSLLNTMTGLEYNDLKTRRTTSNALNVFKQLTLNGLRFIPKYEIGVNELTGQNMTNLSATANYLLDDLLALSPGELVEIEKMLLGEKLIMIAPYIRRGVVIYSYFTTDIIDKIVEFVKELGFTTGTYTGEESPYFREQNLKKFIKGDIDVLIGSKPIGTGVDGLQEVCNRMAVITLPWTDSEFIQLKGRIYRQGSIFDNVEFIIPQVKIELGEGEIWSWDIQRLNLIKHKKTLADAAVDGIIPSTTMPTPSTMLKKSIESLERWKDRINQGQIIEKEREFTQTNLYPEISDENTRQNRINSELSEFNRRGKTTHSSTMHKEFIDDPESWHRYHALRNDRMNEWTEIPYEYIATKIRNTRSVVADFGCGENKMRNFIPKNTVHAFDHVACDESVVACDIRDVSEYLENESVDVAVFSLALWGTNYKEYIKEAYRVLAYNGVIHIAEPARNYETPESEKELVDLISEAGF